MSVSAQLAWKKPPEAQEAWREALEQSGVLVFLLQLGRDSSQGFSLWDEYAPVVAASTAPRVEARVFSLLHEYGHLLTRTSSVCVFNARPSRGRKEDPAERWCERFAAAVLLPWRAVTQVLEMRFGWDGESEITELEWARAIATRFKVSVRASVLRLIEKGVARWALYSQIPPAADDKPKGGGASEGRRRRRIRGDAYGRRAHELLVAAMRHELLGRTDVLSLLDISDRDLDAWERELR